MSKDTVNETCSCCCLDMGTLLDNTDCTAHFERNFDTEEAAQATLDKLTQSARKIESEPCQIKSEIIRANSQFILKADFIFSCQAETVIFQLKLK